MFSWNHLISWGFKCLPGKWNYTSALLPNKWEKLSTIAVAGVLGSIRETLRFINVVEFYLSQNALAFILSYIVLFTGSIIYDCVSWSLIWNWDVAFVRYSLHTYFLNKGSMETSLTASRCDHHTSLFGSPVRRPAVLWNVQTVLSEWSSSGNWASWWILDLKHGQDALIFWW